MEPTIINLDTFRIPDYQYASLQLDKHPLVIFDTSTLTSETTPSNLTIPTGLATVLYNWCPTALTAFLDLDAWFSFTWSLRFQDGQTDETRLEIGRVGNQITFGSLSKDGDAWTLMLTYNIVLDGENRGMWVPNKKESMEGDRDLTDTAAIERLGKEFVTNMVLERRWKPGRKVRHQFYVEYAPMDIWGDGIRMNPHWLYQSLDLNVCTSCSAKSVEGSRAVLDRCSKCGTAAYCSEKCQRKDWNVHKDICNMSMEDRGQAMKITENGGLIGWDRERMFAKEGSGEASKNPNFVVPQLKRYR